MRRYLIYILLLLPLSIAAVPTYFCTDVGTTLNYVRKYVDSGEVKWHHTLTVKYQYNWHDDTTTIVTSSEFKDADSKPLIDIPVSQYVRIASDGTLKLSLTNAVVAILHTTLPFGHAKTVETGAVLPANMKPGDILPSADANVTILGLKYRVKVTERKVLRYETITTPAGTFDCIVISEHKVEKAPAYRRETTALSWYADGIGYVRHDTYDKNMHLETSEQLYSIDRKID